IYKQNRMKRYLLFLAFLCIFSFSCKDKWEVPLEERVGFINGGQQLISAYNATSEFIFESPVYKSGVGNGQTMIKVGIDKEVLAAYNEANGTSLELLPEGYYTIENNEFQLTDDNANTVVKVRIDIKK